MKKSTLVLALGALCASILSGCKSKSRYKTPKTPFEKVTVALNGVTKSFENYKYEESTSSSAKTRSGKRIAQSDASGALADIADIYKSYDTQGDRVDELDLDKPPMIQFQCLKRFVETVGSGYSFGTKYTDTITGTVYFDPSTGDKKGQDDTYKYNYSFTASLLLNIDESDLITGDVAFKTVLTQGQTVLETNWYFAMSLAYEMSIESPTYKLSMYEDNEESDLSYLDYGNTYEYDYIDMKSARVNEWRKFCYEVNKRMVKDANHSTYADYVSEPDFKAQIGSSKWYKNAVLSKITHPNRQKTNDFISALFDKFGLNSTDINGAAFTSKDATQNQTITQIYNEFSAKFAEDAVYGLITGNEGHKQQKVRDSMKLMDDNFEEISGSLVLTKDSKFKDLFNGEIYSIWYFDENGVALEQAEDLNTLEFKLQIPYGSNGEKKVYGYESFEKTLSELFEELGPKHYDERLTYALLEINDYLDGLNIFISVTIDQELEEQIELYFKGFFPYQLKEDGFPEYEGEKCLFDYKDELQTYVDISNTNQTELDAFKNKLTSSPNNWVEDVRTNSVFYRKLVGSTLYVMEINSSNIDKGNVRIVYNKVDWPRYSIKSLSHNVFDLAVPQTVNGYFELDENNPGVIALKNFTESEKDAFLFSLLTSGSDADIRNNAIFVLKQNHVYKFGLTVNEDEIIFDYNYKADCDYSVCELIIEKDGVNYRTIQLDSDLKGYFLSEEFDVGVYKVKKHDLVSQNETYIPIEGSTKDSYAGKVSYNSNSLELEVTAQTTLDLRMNLDNTSQIELFDLNN